MNVPGHVVRRVGAEDIPRVQALFALDPHYWEQVEAQPLRPDEAALLLDERPPGISLAQKQAFLVDDIALLDMSEGYPEPTTWFLGLIFLAPSVRGRGLGTRLLEALCDHVRANGGRALRLAVAQQHPEARRLYDRLGFQYVVTRTRTTYIGAKVELDVMERAL